MTPIEDWLGQDGSNVIELSISSAEGGIELSATVTPAHPWAKARLGSNIVGYFAGYAIDLPLRERTYDYGACTYSISASRELSSYTDRVVDLSAILRDPVDKTIEEQGFICVEDIYKTRKDAVRITVAGTILIAADVLGINSTIDTQIPGLNLKTPFGEFTGPTTFSSVVSTLIGYAQPKFFMLPDGSLRMIGGAYTTGSLRPPSTPPRGAVSYTVTETAPDYPDRVIITGGHILDPEAKAEWEAEEPPEKPGKPIGQNDTVPEVGGGGDIPDYYDPSGDNPGQPSNSNPGGEEIPGDYTPTDDPYGGQPPSNPEIPDLPEGNEVPEECAPLEEEEKNPNAQYVSETTTHSEGRTANGTTFVATTTTTTETKFECGMIASEKHTTTKTGPQPEECWKGPPTEEEEPEPPEVPEPPDVPEPPEEPPIVTAPGGGPTPYSMPYRGGSDNVEAVGGPDSDLELFTTSQVEETIYEYDEECRDQKLLKKTRTVRASDWVVPPDDTECFIMEDYLVESDTVTNIWVDDGRLGQNLMKIITTKVRFLGWYIPYEQPAEEEGETPEGSGWQVDKIKPLYWTGHDIEWWYDLKNNTGAQGDRPSDYPRYTATGRWWHGQIITTLETKESQDHNEGFFSPFRRASDVYTLSRQSIAEVTESPPEYVSCINRDMYCDPKQRCCHGYSSSAEDGQIQYEKTFPVGLGQGEISVTVPGVNGLWWVYPDPREKDKDSAGNFCWEPEEECKEWQEPFLAEDLPPENKIREIALYSAVAAKPVSSYSIEYSCDYPEEIVFPGEPSSKWGVVTSLEASLSYEEGSGVNVTVRQSGEFYMLPKTGAH